jgi:signal transduction histidine kinase
MTERVLCVDDDASILASYQRMFRKRFSIDIATSVQEAWDLIGSRGPYAVVVADWRMPRTDGLQFLTELRTKAPTTVRMLLSGFADLQAAIVAVNEGHVFRLLTKPCLPDTLAQAIADGIALYRMVIAETERLDRLARALRMLGRCHQALIRAPDESALLEETSRTIEEVGGYRTVRVLFTERDDVALHGGDEFVTLPLAAEGRRLGALAVSADAGAMFDQEEMRLLQQVADDLAYGIVALRTRAERTRVELELAHQREAVREREKLAAMGELIAGVAHELNNPLAVVIGRVTLLERQLAGTSFEARLSPLADAANRCARIVRHFLDIARRRPPERAAVYLNEVVDETIEFLGHGLRVDNIELELNEEAHLPPLWGDRHQLHQVVVNLVTNAHHAMRQAPRPRRLTVTTRAAGDRLTVVLEVADTGPGIPPDIRQRIFEPFFTTKPPGQGTGLGLPLCRGIIDAHGGLLHVISEAGRGATFIAEIPVGEAPTGTPKPDGVRTVLRQRSKRILVAEDDAQVADMIAEMLALDEHRVDIAANGAIALAKLRTNRYDLVLCDLRMPELDGPGLYRTLEHERPDLCRRFIFVTSDTLSPDLAAFLESTGRSRLDKPIILQDLSHLVQSRLRELDETPLASAVVPA